MPDQNIDRETYFTLFNEIGIISQLSRAMFERRLPEGYLLPHFSVLNHLIRVRDGQTPLALARAFQVPKTTMTHMLGILERGALIALKPNPEDGRSKCVWITDDGRRFRDNAIASLDPDFVALASSISLKDASSLLPGLQALRKYLDQARDPKDD